MELVDVDEVDGFTLLAEEEFSPGVKLSEAGELVEPPKADCTIP